MITRSGFRRIVRRARIEAIVDAQRQAKDCAVCTAICSHRLPYSIDAAVDGDGGIYCPWAANGHIAPTYH
jgi:hypothetical protein